MIDEKLKETLERTGKAICRHLEVLVEEVEKVDGHVMFVGYRQFNSSYEVTLDCAWTKNGVTHESKITPAAIFTTGTCTANGGFVGNLTGNADTASYSLNSGGVNGYTIEVLQASNIPMRISFI